MVLAGLLTVSLIALITGVVTEPLQLASPGHLLEPPPLALAVLETELATLEPTATGTVMTILPLATPATILQPAKLVAPDAGQELIVAPVAVITPLVIMPVGSVSLIVKSAVVGPSIRAIVIW